jgi:hypothetical protein
MVLFSCFLHIFQILLLNPIIAWGHGSVCLIHKTHPVRSLWHWLYVYFVVFKKVNFVITENFYSFYY